MTSFLNMVPAVTKKEVVIPPPQVIKTVCRRSYSFPCPACNRYNFTISPESHLNKDFTWSCSNCDHTWDVKVGATVDDITLQRNLRPHHQRERGWALLKYLGGGMPLYLVIEASRSTSDGEEQGDYHMRYYYDEHTCPTNFLGVEKIVFNGDGDPHGIFAFQRFMNKKEACEKLGWTPEQLEKTQMDGNGIRDYWMDLFPELAVQGSSEPCTYFEG